jgi:hypothetical protein
MLKKIYCSSVEIQSKLLSIEPTLKGFENKVREKYISKSQAYTTRQNHGSFQM